MRPVKTVFQKMTSLKLVLRKKTDLLSKIRFPFLNPQLISDTLPIQNQFLKLKKKFK